MLFWVRLLLVFLASSDLASIARAFLKRLIPRKAVRRLDDFRISSSERRAARIRRLSERAANRSSTSASYLAWECVRQFSQSGTRPKDEAVREIVSRSSGFEESLALYSLFFSQGLVRESTELRVRARTQLLEIGRVSMQRTPSRLSRRVVGAAVEAGWREDHIEALLATRKTLVNSFSAGICQSDFSAGARRSENSAEFGETLNSARVLLLGPNPAEGSQHLPPLENYDVLVVLNFLAGTHPSEAEMKIARKSSVTTVAYYNEYNAKKMFHARECRPRPGPDWSVYRSLSYGYQGRQYLAGSARTLWKNRNIVDGVWQGLPSVLFDLLHFSPSLIHVSGFDAYLSRRPYAPGYSTRDTKLHYDLARHDPVGNFLFLKQLFEAGFYSADSALASTLNLDIFEYMASLDSCLSLADGKIIEHRP